MPDPLQTLLCASLSLPDVSGGAPDWVHLLPRGEVRTFDGRGPYRVTDAPAVMMASFADPRGLPIDENHATDLAAPAGHPAPARGWIKEMQLRLDGIWGRVEWTEAGRALVADRAYRGISPVLMHDKATGQITRIARASLVNTPNLRDLIALHSQQDMKMNDMERLAEAVGLEAGATVDQMIDAIKAMKTAKTDTATAAMQSAIGEIGVALGVQQGADLVAIVAAANAAKTAGRSEVAALQSELAAVTTRLNGITESAARERATTFVDGEIKRGRVGIKPLRDHYISMHMADAARVEKEIGAMPVLGASGAAVLPPAAKDGQVSLNAEQTAVAKALGVDLKTYAATLQAEQKETV
jgi:phage I-like protein